jgi:hypothetical protein
MSEFNFAQLQIAKERSTAIWDLMREFPGFRLPNNVKQHYNAAASEVGERGLEDPSAWSKKALFLVISAYASFENSVRNLLAGFFRLKANQFNRRLRSIRAVNLQLQNALQSIQEQIHQMLEMAGENWIDIRVAATLYHSTYQEIKALRPLRRKYDGGRLGHRQGAHRRLMVLQRA